ncbi:MAG: MerR family transcriptional regulator [Lachnospiraceae bacterium]
MPYTIKQVSEMMNIPISTIRYYDKEGLLPFLEKKPSGYRIFKDSDITMLQVIECFKSTGMSVAEMQQFIQMVKRGDESLEERYNLFCERKNIVQKQMENLQKQMDIIDHKLWYYETAIKAGTEAIHKEHNTKCNE